VMFQIASAAVFVLAFSDLVETAWAQIRMRIRRKQGALTGHEALLLCPALLDFDEPQAAAVDFDEEPAAIENYEPPEVEETEPFEVVAGRMEAEELLARLDLDQLERNERTDFAESEQIHLNGARLLESMLAEALAKSTAPVEEDEPQLQPVLYNDDELAARPLLCTGPANVVSASDDDDDGGAYNELGSLPPLPTAAYALL
jgi:hypothetical protein